MQRKFNLSQLVEIISTINGCSINTADLFLKSLFTAIADSLQNGETVSIKGLGEFKRSENEDEFILFLPDENLMEVVNAPFSSFEAVELDDDVTEEIFKNELEEVVPMVKTIENLPLEDFNSEVKNEFDNIENTIDESSNEPIIGVDLNINAKTEVVEVENSPIEYSTNETNNNEEICEMPKIDKTSRLYPKSTIVKFSILFFMLGLIAGFTIGISINIMQNGSQMTKTLEKHQKILDSITFALNSNSVPINIYNNCQDSSQVNISRETDTIINNQIIIDEITRSRFLTTMAREYYGNLNFWVYIYEENRDKLGHPDKIKPGTKVIIPSKEKYNINAQDLNSIERAKEKAQKIYSNFEK